MSESQEEVPIVNDAIHDARYNFLYIRIWHSLFFRSQYFCRSVHSRADVHRSSHGFILSDPPEVIMVWCRILIWVGFPSRSEISDAQSLTLRAILFRDFRSTSKCGNRSDYALCRSRFSYSPWHWNILCRTHICTETRRLLFVGQSNI